MSESYQILAGDYAVIRAGDARLYYGYEVTRGPDDEWCFEAELRSARVVIPFSEIGGRARDQFDVAECLMAGIGKLMERGQLTLNLEPPA